ncbi:ornithine cyclodeaminase family protein [Cytobacillus oceanisediminis]|uniref:ornithine cyclodeaminase family protein n=1 Tax=Cytobacillus oceanisediminis TaxID=665099 RepID=UPI00203A6F50|nr:ornithine cyclodeaminase family protein [Cytobacillus oceanisediminis]MCM3405976.1 ornithine cyclodeaminase family protein [Cytobacillus oceanisediminis]
MIDLSAMGNTEFLLLSRSEIASMISSNDYLTAMESVFRKRSEGRALVPGLMHADVEDGEFHIKSGGLKIDKTYFALKANGGFFGNCTKFGLPNIIGLIILFDGSNGRPLSIMDSTEITSKRTAATTAVAAKYLARSDSSTVTICGSGNQARVQLKALMNVISSISQVYVWGTNQNKIEKFSKEMSEELKVNIEATDNLADVAPKSDIIITCTSAKKFFLHEEYVRPGTFISAVGADSPDKQELDPQLLASGKLVVDILEQCAHVGELHHAMDANLMSTGDVYGEFGDIVTGKIDGRTNSEEIIIFDTTGSAIQDTAAAAAVYEKAISLGRGKLLNIYE